MNVSSCAPAWGQQESVLKLGLDLAFSGDAADYLTPGDWQMLDKGDTDISGSGPVVLDAPGMAKKLVLALGKDGNAYLIDPANMGGMGGTIVAQTTVSHGAISNAAAWASIGGKVYVVANNNWTAGSGCALGGMDNNGGKNQNDKPLTGVEIPNTASIPSMATLSSSLIAAGGRIYAASTQGSVYAATL